VLFGRRVWAILAVAVILSGATLLAWWLASPVVAAPDIVGRFHGAAYQPYRPGQSPTGAQPTAAEVDEDLALLSRHMRAVRTYSSLGVLAELPALAAAHGLEVVQGIWVDGDRERSRREIEAGVPAATSRSVKRILVGNEVLLRHDLSVPELVSYIREVRRRTGKPVSTAEPWSVWMQNPALARQVDFIAIHVLPYWEETTTEDALSYAIDKIERVKARFPGKPVVVAEIGWPSDGRPRWNLRPGLAEEARFVRGALDYAARTNTETFVMEAFDGTWKYTIEGSVGAYWGLFDAARRLKFPLSGAVETRGAWPWLAATSLGTGWLGLVWLAWRSPNRTRSLLLQGGAVFAAASGALWILELSVSRYFTLPGAAMWAFLMSLMLLLAAVLKADLAETCSTLDRPPRRAPEGPLRGFPPVSIHLPIHCEPPEVVAATLRGLARLDWPDFEVIVVDNNTIDALLWRPVEQECARLNAAMGREAFRFIHVEGLRGFKAGALNLALRHTRADAVAIGVIDADYIVDPAWLRRAMLYLEDPAIGFVQAPQDHRDMNDSAFKRVIGWEYAGFFNVGMVQRDLDDAIIQHGTMALIRRAALERAGGWAEWCITEDAELGLRLHAQGWKSAYIRNSLGWGLLPDDWAAYAGQRHRWAYGGMRILRRFWRLFLPGASLRPRQRLCYFAGWLPWIGDAIGVVFAVLSVLWTGLNALFPDYIELPDPVLFVPAVAAFAMRIGFSFTTHRLRVPCGFADSLRAALAGIALAPTIGLAVLHGLFVPGAPFRRTPKAAGRARLGQALTAVQMETALAIGLSAASAWALGVHYDEPGGVLWGGALLVQAIPPVSAIVLSLTACRRGRPPLAAAAAKPEPVTA
jgi:exo-beta-1,3-glucanase (GH17 family)/cellulose synthase/poly-beta-1,6-N-acetylglucosamine synthase-like glycosyltransferase